MIKQSKLPKIKGKYLSNLFIEKYMLKLGEFNNTTGTERVKWLRKYVIIMVMVIKMMAVIMIMH